MRALLFVYDPLEHRGWGPFFTEEEANFFIEHDKYLVSCAVVINKRSDYRNCTWYLPENYNEKWAVGLWMEDDT